MDRGRIESLPVDLWYIILQHLDLSESALLSLCSKTLYDAVEGREVLKKLKNYPNDYHKFLLVLERDLPISHLYCSADARFHHAKVTSSWNNAAGSAITFSYEDKRWKCVREDFRNETELFIGSGLHFHQARMLLKLFKRQHPLVQRYLDSLDLCEITQIKPLAFLRRELKVRWVRSESRPLLLARIQHWFFGTHKETARWLREGRPFTSNPFPNLKICYHLPSAPHRWVLSHHMYCMTKGSSWWKKILSCTACGTEYSLDPINLPNPPKFYISSHLPFSMSRTNETAWCVTKWMNLGTLEAQSDGEWRRFAYVSPSERILDQLTGPRRAFELFEGEAAPNLEKYGKDGYTPMWTQDLERRVKERLKMKKN